MSGDLPPDPFAEPDGRVDAIADGERLHRALAEIAVLGSLGEFAAAVGSLSEGQAKKALVGHLIGLARDVHEAHGRKPDGSRLRRAWKAAVEEWRR